MNSYSEMTEEEKAQFFCAWPELDTPELGHLKAQVDAYSRMGMLLYPYLMQRGRVWRPAPLPADLRRGPSGQCSQNAAKLVLANPATLSYVEGYAVPAGGLATGHAWAVTADGTVIDNTWVEPGQAPILASPLT
ncbi:hypothetical protein [Burkholderia cenocepacia]|uniref:hypothetical protein n=1 Tax=Burkholderia cenocepacia TaxID=95486 RepID=UPI00076201F6|nr:hypothetical protein [Burkholderia cenocepacia]KWU23397.1 hypothetical protein AS149_37040 [Burkholderia cenocepacia]